CSREAIASLLTTLRVVPTVPIAKLILHGRSSLDPAEPRCAMLIQTIPSSSVSSLSKCEKCRVHAKTSMAIFKSLSLYFHLVS
ncbi:MAG: hypothetical protein VX003_07575, partial [SAR324 cluster bacterium]|nr:hypothetical protein [SAR324 cluster bacterium]